MFHDSQDVPKRNVTGRTRSQRGRARNSSDQGTDLPHIPEPVEPLHHSENRWIPYHSLPDGDEDPLRICVRKLRSMLNKLTTDKFDSISRQVVQVANGSHGNQQILPLVIDTLFQSALNDEKWSILHANLCQRIMEDLSPEVTDDSLTDPDGDPLCGGDLFREHVLNRSEAGFKRGWSATLNCNTTSSSNDQSESPTPVPPIFSDDYYALCKEKRKGLALVRLIGELYKVDLFPEAALQWCLQTLLAASKEEDVESLSKLLNTVGRELDGTHNQDRMDIYFKRIEKLSNARRFRPRIQYMLLDLLELRDRGWTPRRNTITDHEVDVDDQSQDSETKSALNLPEAAEIDAILETLARDNAQAIANQLTECAGDSREGYTIVLDRILHKAALDEPKSGVYAFVCRTLTNHLFNIASHVDKGIGYWFMQTTLARSQEYFNQRREGNDMSLDAGESSVSENGGTDPGLVRFTGELLRQKIAKHDAVFDRIESLLEGEPPNDQDLESLCTLLRHVGRILDTPDTEILAVRQRGWQQRFGMRPVFSPKTSWRGADPEASEEPQAAPVRNAKQKMERRLSSTRESRPNDASQPVENGWVVPGRQPTSPQESNRFGKSKPLVMGPSNVFNKRRGSKSQTTPIVSPSYPTTSSNMFKLLDEGAEEPIDEKVPDEPREKETSFGGVQPSWGGSAPSW
ncbi:hypothetical protein FRB99_005025 [Tulasnella sp. 403]|nr:hypothetical protein FRB99_005025 [Tulasnella sp. 403]